MQVMTVLPQQNLNDIQASVQTAELAGYDQICSMEPDELLELCRFRDDCEEILYKDS